MIKKRISEPWMPASDYGQKLIGMSNNLLVENIGQAVAFQAQVLKADVVYSDPDFAVLRGYGSEWIMHADHTYSDHPLSGTLITKPQRGVGVELRIHGCDPDAAEAAARERGDIVLVGAMDKPHGLREVYIIDPDGYIWVPDIPIIQT